MNVLWNIYEISFYNSNIFFLSFRCFGWLASASWQVGYWVLSAKGNFSFFQTSSQDQNVEERWFNIWTGYTWKINYNDARDLNSELSSRS